MRVIRWEPLEPELAGLYHWWTVFAWRWGVKLGPLTIDLYRWDGKPECDISVFGRWTLTTWL